MIAPLSHRCQAQFSSDVRLRGESYSRSGKVRSFRVGKGRIEALVKGSVGFYSVLLDWSEPGTQGTLGAYCSCPYFRDVSYCKHLWAVVRQADARYVGHVVAGTGSLRLRRLSRMDAGVGTVDPGRQAHPWKSRLPLPIRRLSFVASSPEWRLEGGEVLGGTRLSGKKGESV